MGVYGEISRSPQTRVRKPERKNLAFLSVIRNNLQEFVEYLSPIEISDTFVTHYGCCSYLKILFTPTIIAKFKKLDLPLDIAI